MALLEVRGLSVRYGPVQALDDVSFDVEAGETLAVLGESGSGKSTLALAIVGLLPKSSARVEAEALRFAGRDLARLTERELRAVRGREIATVFQDPSTSLCPWLTVGEQLAEVLEVHRGASAREARRSSAAALGEVGIADPESRLDAFPHELSGGMKQRATIAAALLLAPRLLVADEPTSALDATVQAQILDLLAALQKKHGTAILLVTHSLGVVAAAADRALVMRRGRIVETAGVRELFRAPQHEYTRELLASVPGRVVR
ncbi:MAG TPA: ABC transporter ATP-binding protein [Thermoanaerobaculia bacterium]|nr:ABC transporter ATP-binding protein [Thermoanaerobaculia bacterium]